MKKYLNIATVYLVIGLLGGIFFREFTKLNGFEGETMLKAIHPHALILGFGMFISVMILDKVFMISQTKGFSVWLKVYNVGVIYLLAMLLTRGVMQVQGTDMAGLSHMAGLGHAILGGALIWFMVILHKTIKE